MDGLEERENLLTRKRIKLETREKRGECEREREREKGRRSARRLSKREKEKSSALVIIHSVIPFSRLHYRNVIPSR